ncbi:nuclear transport factor 2 family protein [Streptomyces sp. NPDC097610]|uniref:nuclear transport factor 2 family protein n=1 Tax=Streptomyces sp. NPDC097610 TaxID=3157227 RepID=UPI00331A7A7E
MAAVTLDAGRTPPTCATHQGTYLSREFGEENPVNTTTSVRRRTLAANIPDGLAGVKAALGAYFAQFPQLRITPKRIIAEGDLVAVHSHTVNVPGERGQAVVDLFRVRRGRIVEHWDAVQDAPETSANGNTMF